LDTDATHYFFANPMPGTKLWEMCVENDYFREGFSLDKIRVERANIDTPELHALKLERLVAREQLVGKMLSLLKHPLRMAKKYISYIKKDHRIVLNFIVKNIKQSLTIK